MRLSTPAGRLLLAAVTLASGMAFLDASIVTLALPAIEDDLGAGVAGLQWTVNGYTLTLAALVLVAGSLGDKLGRRRVFVVGVVWFALASLACAVAPTIEVLVAARVLQGVGGALLTPGSLAIITTSIHPDDRGRAIGLWSGMSGITTAIGPLVGGWLVDVAGWRSVFWINLPLAIAVVVIALKAIPESRGEQGRLDVLGSALTVTGLAVLTYGLVDENAMLALTGVVVLVAFVLQQWRTPHALVPLSLFSDRVFTVTNLGTFGIYAALSGSMFLIVLQLQYVAGYTPLEAGAATLPIPILLLFLAGRAGALGQRIGPRWPLSVGPWVCAAGLAWATTIGSDASLWTDVLPPVTVFSLGLTLIVAPLTSAVLSSAPTMQAGIASGINNAVARTAGLLAVAAIPPLAGITGANFDAPEVFGPGYRAGLWMCVGLLVVAGALAAVALPRFGLGGEQDRQ